MPPLYIPFSSRSNTYLKYNRPEGYIDVFAASIATGLKPDELVQRFLLKRLNVYLDCHSYRDQGELLELLLKQEESRGSTQTVGNLPGTLFIADAAQFRLIEPRIYPLSHNGLKKLVYRYKVGHEGENLLTGLCLLTPEAESLIQQFRDTEDRIFVRLENPLFTGHPWFHPYVVVRLQDLEEAMRNPSPDLSSEIERVWISRAETEIFNPTDFPFEFISEKRSCIDPDKEQRLQLLCNEWSTQLRALRVSEMLRNPKPLAAAIPKGIARKIEVKIPLEKLASLFLALVQKEYLEEGVEQLIEQHFTNLGPAICPAEAKRINWLKAKSGLQALSRLMGWRTKEVSVHFNHRGASLTLPRSGTDIVQQENMLKLLEEVSIEPIKSPEE